MIRNKLDGKFYIGSAKNIERRWYNQHTNSKEDDYFHNAIRKHGFENFEMFSIQAVENDADALLAVEQLYLDSIFSNCPDMIYNICRKAGSGPVMLGEKNPFYGKTHSQEIRQKIGEAKRGSKNPQYDHTIHSFINTRTGETFTGTRFEFYTVYGLNQGNVSQMILGKRRSVKGWILTSLASIVCPCKMK